MTGLADDDEDITGLRGFEVSGTPTTGIRIWCIRCERWFVEWTSRQLYPRMAEMVTECEDHVRENHVSKETQ